MRLFDACWPDRRKRAFRRAETRGRPDQPGDRVECSPGVRHECWLDQPSELNTRIVRPHSVQHYGRRSSPVSGQMTDHRRLCRIENAIGKSVGNEVDSFHLRSPLVAQQTQALLLMPGKQADFKVM